jgi:hypothetical protein
MGRRPCVLAWRMERWHSKRASTGWRAMSPTMSVIISRDLDAAVRPCAAWKARWSGGRARPCGSMATMSRSITAQLDEREPPRYASLAIDPGSRVIVQVLDIRLEGDAARDAPFRDTVETFPLAEGDPLEHAPWDRMRNRLANCRPRARLFRLGLRTDRRMEVRPFDESARLYLTLDSGQRYRFR